MAYEKVGGNSGPVFKWDAAGKVIEGFFMGLKAGKQFANASERSRLALIVPVSGGEQMAVGTTKGLADDLSGIPIGVLVRIEYKGLARSAGGREFKSFDIQADRTRTFNGAPAQAPQQQTQPQQPSSGIAGLEQKLHGNKGAQVAGLMIDALKAKYPDPAVYEKNLRELLVAHGVAV